MIKVIEDVYIAESEYADLEELESVIKEITEKTDRWYNGDFDEEDYQGFRDFLDSSYSTFQTHPKGYKYYPSAIIETMTPDLFEQGVKEHYDSEYEDWFHDLEILEKTLEKYKREDKIFWAFHKTFQDNLNRLVNENRYLIIIQEDPDIIDTKQTPYCYSVLLKLIDLLEYNDQEKIKEKLENDPQYLFDSLARVTRNLALKMGHIQEISDSETDFYSNLSNLFNSDSDINFDNYYKDRLENDWEYTELEYIFLDHN